jgi:hypothetical protein
MDIETTRTIIVTTYKDPWFTRHEENQQSNFKINEQEYPEITERVHHIKPHETAGSDGDGKSETSFQHETQWTTIRNVSSRGKTPSYP